MTTKTPPSRNMYPWRKPVFEVFCQCRETTSTVFRAWFLWKTESFCAENWFDSSPGCLNGTRVTSKRLNTTKAFHRSWWDSSRPTTVKPFYSQLQRGKRFMVFVLLYELHRRIGKPLGQYKVPLLNESLAFTGKVNEGAHFSPHPPC